MKLAFYYEDGFKQLIFTPENDYETDILKQVKDGDKNLTWKFGDFYECQGGWVRQGMSANALMLIINKKEVK